MRTERFADESGDENLFSVFARLSTVLVDYILQLFHRHKEGPSVTSQLSYLAHKEMSDAVSAVSE